jgi:mannonate dehydratase
LIEEAGLTLYGFGNTSVHNQDAIVLNLPGRDDKIEEYKRHLRNLSRAGIPYTTYAHMANGIWSTGREPTRGGASSRAFDEDKAEVGEWAGSSYSMPLSHGRTYSAAEIWRTSPISSRPSRPLPKRRAFLSAYIQTTPRCRA